MSKKDKKAKDEPKEEEVKKPEGKDGETAAEGEVAPKKSKKKLIIIVVAAIVLVGGIVGGLLASGVLGGGKKDAKTAEAKPVLDKDGKEIPLNKDGKPMDAGGGLRRINQYFIICRTSW